MEPGDHRRAMRVLLLSCYELGHQPWHLASAGGFLREAGHSVRARDLALDELDDGDVRWAQLIAVAVPMHTAMRLALPLVRRLRAQRGVSVTIVLYGLYAPLCAASLPGGSVDHAVGGEFEGELVRIAGGARSSRAVVLDRLRFPPPERDGLPSLRRYARLLVGGEARVAGYLESTRGCVHRCRHCPVPVVYDGRIRIVQRETVVADAVRQWELGARHLTLGDADFLNAAPYALATMRALHARLPEMTFDITTKVEHILRHRGVVAQLSECGLLFVTTAVESTSDTVLSILDKGHTHADSIAAIALLRAEGIEVRPSLLPFTPWSTLADYLHLLDFVAALDLQASIDPVQLGIRLLLPAGSLLLEHPATAAHLTGELAAGGEHLWRHPDPSMDALQAEVADLTALAADAVESPQVTHDAVRRLAGAAAARAGLAWDAAPPPPPVGLSVVARPRLSEPWFC